MIGDNYRVLYTSELSTDVLNRMEATLGEGWHIDHIANMMTGHDVRPSFKLIWKRDS